MTKINLCAIWNNNIYEKRIKHIVWMVINTCSMKLIAVIFWPALCGRSSCYIAAYGLYFIFYKWEEMTTPFPETRIQSAIVRKLSSVHTQDDSHARRLQFCHKWRNQGPKGQTPTGAMAICLWPDNSSNTPNTNCAGYCCPFDDHLPCMGHSHEPEAYFPLLYITIWKTSTTCSNAVSGGKISLHWVSNGKYYSRWMQLEELDCSSV